jgi:hypothetical protein
MANYTAKRGHNPKKVGGKRITANLANLELVNDIPLNRTDTIDTSLLMLSIVKDAALEGMPEAITLLARVGLKVSFETVDPVVVLRPDGEVADWIV